MALNVKYGMKQSCQKSKRKKESLGNKVEGKVITQQIWPIPRHGKSQSFTMLMTVFITEI